MQTINDEHRMMFMPFYPANQIKKSFAVTHESTEHSNYFTILDISHANHGIKSLRVPALYRHMADSFGKMVRVCLTQQREGDLTQDMLDTLIDTIETFKPHERLILLLSDLETYRNL